MSARNATPPTLTAEEVVRFWLKVRRVENPLGCWRWLGVFVRGYGRVSIRRNAAVRGLGAHRIAFLLATDEWPPVVMHWCDNRSCVNPLHLRSGTNDDNMRDMAEKGRAATGDRHGLHLHPERIARGDKHGARTHPEAFPRGDRHWSRIRPDAVRRGSQINTARLVEADIPIVREMLATGISCAALARQMGMSKKIVWRIHRGDTWNHVP